MATIRTVTQVKRQSHVRSVRNPTQRRRTRISVEVRGKLRYPGVHSVRGQKWKIALVAGSLPPVRKMQIGFGATFGKGRVFYSTQGHTNEAWGDPQIQQVYFEAVKWVLGMTDGRTAGHPRTPALGRNSSIANCRP